MDSSSSSSPLKLVLGPSGVLQGIRPGKCYIEMSTVDPETITELSQVYSKINFWGHLEIWNIQQITALK